MESYRLSYTARLRASDVCLKRRFAWAGFWKFTRTCRLEEPIRCTSVILAVVDTFVSFRCSAIRWRFAHVWSWLCSKPCQKFWMHISIETFSMKQTSMICYPRSSSTKLKSNEGSRWAERLLERTCRVVEILTSAFGLTRAVATDRKKEAVNNMAWSCSLKWTVNNFNSKTEHGQEIWLSSHTGRMRTLLSVRLRSHNCFGSVEEGPEVQAGRRNSRPEREPEGNTDWLHHKPTTCKKVSSLWVQALRQKEDKHAS